MTVVCVLNYKGGVGKTTVTANLGAELANRGRRVLLVDVDPQASLTLSFYGSEELDRQFATGGTIMHWFQSFLESQSLAELGDYVVTPERVNQVVRHSGGRLDLIASHLGLIDVDLDLAAFVGGSRFSVSSPGYLWAHRLLADALVGPAFAGYDVVLIDCAPNFNMVTRTAVVAADHVVIPAKADYLSTLGIDYLRRKLSELVRDYNTAAGADEIHPEILGVVFTMIQFAADVPIIAVRNYVTQTEQYAVPIFHQMIRESKTLFATAGERGIPAVLLGAANPNVLTELRELASEFLDRLDGARPNATHRDSLRLNGAQANGAQINGAQINGAQINGAQITGSRPGSAHINGPHVNGARLDTASLGAAP
jgi:chromosome partitioning protein